MTEAAAGELEALDAKAEGGDAQAAHELALRAGSGFGAPLGNEFIDYTGGHSATIGCTQGIPQCIGCGIGCGCGAACGTGCGIGCGVPMS